MAEALTFANYQLDRDGAYGIYEIGADDKHETGVIPEMAAAFGHDLGIMPSVDNLGELIGRVGPAKELQENIGRVQETLGTDDDAVAIARGWAERSGLLVPVARSYVTAEAIEGPVDLAVITGGVRNWMWRRAQRLLQLDDEVGVKQVMLVAGNRPMKTTEGSDVEEGMVESDYMGQVIMSQIMAGDRNLQAVNVAVDSAVGDEVMESGAAAILGEGLAEQVSGKVAVVSNAGAWVQNAGQFRRAIRFAVDDDFDHDGSEFFAVSDGFPLGTGTEPAATHQNPFSAIGQIARNAQELARHINQIGR